MLIREGLSGEYEEIVLIKTMVLWNSSNVVCVDNQ